MHAKKGVVQLGDFLILANAYAWKKTEPKNEYSNTGLGKEEETTIKVGQVTIIHKDLLLTNQVVWEEGALKGGLITTAMKFTFSREDKNAKTNTESNCIGKKQEQPDGQIKGELYEKGNKEETHVLNGASKSPEAIKVHTHTINSTTTQSPAHNQQPLHFPPSLNQPVPHLSPTKYTTNSEMDRNDEEFLARFANLLAGAGPSAPVKLQAEDTRPRNWYACAMARVVSDRTVQEGGFISTMMKAWGSHSTTEITSLARNVFLIQFVNPQELTRVTARGLWTYRADAVVLRRVYGPSDLVNPTVDKMEVTAQFHKIPPHAISDAGLLKLVKNIGTPMSEVSHAFFAGNKYNKIKMLMPIDKPLQGTIPVDHPELGIFPIYVAYERLNRVCQFCAMVGHDMENCHDKIQMDRIRIDPLYQDQPEIQNLAKPIARPWLTNPALIPSPDQQNEQNEGRNPEQHSHNPPQNHNQFQPNPTTNNTRTDAGLGLGVLGPELNNTPQRPHNRYGQRTLERTLTISQPGLKRAGQSNESPTSSLNQTNQELNDVGRIPAPKRRAVEAPTESAPLPER